MSGLSSARSATDRDDQLRRQAIGPLREGTRNAVCGLCGRRLVRFPLALDGTAFTVVSCGPCGWHVRVQGDAVQDEVAWYTLVAERR